MNNGIAISVKLFIIPHVALDKRLVLSIPHKKIQKMIPVKLSENAIGTPRKRKRKRITNIRIGIYSRIIFHPLSHETY